MEKIVILGSGPAGLTAALYAARAELAPLVITGNQPGGLLTQTSEVENFPGFPEGILGFDLMERFQKQAERFGAKIQYGSVTAATLTPDGPQKLTMDDGSTIETAALIIATGSSPRELGIPAEAALKNKGVSYCATCDGPFFRGKEVAVVGGGDSALEEALFLSRFASQVHLIHRRGEFRGSIIMRERVLANAKITVHWHAVVADLADPSAGKLTSLTLKDPRNGNTSPLPCDGLFVAIGHIPNTALFEDALTLNNGYIVLMSNESSATSIPGVFAAGDCADQVYRQAITAAGMGCRAAIDAERWLASKNQ
ncbi:MAG TPA: thioredoxin-disulfide reductase [Lentisphaeria bacterium]|nr:thioredoxin-disulfide reductase [Lentisphaerota bacterium]HPY89167.1 thioredoxin-disulfide reductase [Lentisphaeria bacterium]HQC51930.1 thioredoxin-disulfide reductase [Lentisphaeria bacterium]